MHPNFKLKNGVKINWRLRVVNKQFWISVIPAILLVIQTLLGLFGYNTDFGDLGNKLLAVVDSIFALLIILGIINDPTTSGITDSERAMQYTKPVGE